MKSKQRENKQNAFGWAVRHGLLPADEPDALVTREEMANAMYRGLEYFFAEMISILKENETKNRDLSREKVKK